MFKLDCALFVIILAALAAPVAAQQRAGDLRIKPYVFEYGQDQKIDAELGILRVPENRSDPESNLIELAFGVSVFAENQGLDARIHARLTARNDENHTAANEVHATETAGPVILFPQPPTLRL